jgi:DNA-binding response OmpR family regulator
MLSAILIVESDSPTLELYRRELSRDFQVLACLDQGEALRLADTVNLRAVVLEPAAAGGQEWFLLPLLLQTLEARKIPLVLCSTQDDRKRGQDVGAAAFLVKPVLPMELRDTLRKIVGQGAAAALK